MFGVLTIMGFLMILPVSLMIEGPKAIKTAVLLIMAVVNLYPARLLFSMLISSTRLALLYSSLLPVDGRSTEGLYEHTAAHGKLVLLGCHKS